MFPRCLSRNTQRCPYTTCRSHGLAGKCQDTEYRARMIRICNASPVGGRNSECHLYMSAPWGKLSQRREVSSVSGQETFHVYQLDNPRRKATRRASMSLGLLPRVRTSVGPCGRCDTFVPPRTTNYTDKHLDVCRWQSFLRLPVCPPPWHISL